MATVDSILNRPHQVYISPYDPQRHVWIVERGGGRGVPMSILKYDRAGVLQYHWGAFGGTRGGFIGGLSRPHQIDVDQQGIVYIASWDGGWVTKYVPKPSADPWKLVGRKLVISR